MGLKDSLPRQVLQKLLTRLLEHVPVFEGFNEVELLDLLNGAEKRVFNPGDIIIREGNAGSYMYVMIDGEAKVQKNTDGRKVYELGVFRSGDCFGEMSLVDRSPRSATVEAITSCVLIRIQESDCWRSTVVGAKIFRNIAGVLAQRLRDLHNVVLENGKSQG